MVKHSPDLNLIFAALSDPTRRETVHRLARGAATVSELAGRFEMSMPAYLGHLDKLEKAGLIRTTKTGRVRSCALKDGALEMAQDWLGEQQRLWETRLDQFDDYVNDLMKERQK